MTYHFPWKFDVTSLNYSPVLSESAIHPYSYYVAFRVPTPVSLMIRRDAQYRTRRDARWIVIGRARCSALICLNKPERNEPLFPLVLFYELNTVCCYSYFCPLHNLYFVSHTSLCIYYQLYLLLIVLRSVLFRHSRFGSARLKR